MIWRTFDLNEELENVKDKLFQQGAEVFVVGIEYIFESQLTKVKILFRKRNILHERLKMCKFLLNFFQNRIWKTLYKL